MTSIHGSRELNELRYGWRSSELYAKIWYYRFHIDCQHFVCLALVAIKMAIIAKLMTKQRHCFTEKAEKMLNQSNDSTKFMYTKLGRKRVSLGCKNCLITGDGTSFFQFSQSS